MSDIRRRVEALEALVPDEIVLTLKDGTTLNHPGPALDFYMEGMKQIRAGRGPIAEAVSRTVSAQGCGLLHELLAALANPVEDTAKITPVPVQPAF